MITRRYLSVSGGSPPEGFTKHVLFDKYDFLVGRLPELLETDAEERFEDLWNLHPAERHLIRKPGSSEMVPVARWQQAYLKDYVYTGNRNNALPLPPILEPYLAWARANVSTPLNGLLLNWYDASEAHYIGQHSDSRTGLIPEEPIVTISLGAERAFRLSLKDHQSVDFPAVHGAVFVLPWETNVAVKHGVPKPRKHERGRRVSVTLRAFT